MKKVCCNVVFENTEGNVRGLFSTEHIINCFNENSISYLRVLEDENIKALFADEELMNTADVVLKNNLNITKASKESYMHRNTLLYRLDKIKRLTGLNLKNFEDAVVFENLLCAKKMLY